MKTREDQQTALALGTDETELRIAGPLGRCPTHRDPELNPPTYGRVFLRPACTHLKSPQNKARWFGMRKGRSEEHEG